MHFGFSSEFSFHQLLRAYLSSLAGTIGQIVANIQSGFGLIPTYKKSDDLKKRQESHPSH
jgi:hypothetical protein